MEFETGATEKSPKLVRRMVGGVTAHYMTIFEVLAAVLMKIQVFWDATVCRLVNSYRRFEGL